MKPKISKWAIVVASIACMWIRKNASSKKKKKKKQEVRKGIEIREAEEEDRKSIVAMTLRMAYETENVKLPLEGVEKGVGTAFQHDKKENTTTLLRLRYWVAYENKNVVGMIGISPEYSDWWGTQYWWIVSLYTIPSHRRQGVASLLLEHVRNMSSHHKVQSLSLRVEVQNEKAQRLYKKVGFVIDKSHHVMTIGRTPGGTNIA